jgi:hypothetical protein
MVQGHTSPPQEFKSIVPVVDSNILVIGLLPAACCHASDNDSRARRPELDQMT